MKKSLFITVLTTLSVSSFAVEQTAADFTTLDANSDGQISQEEALAHEALSASFNELDLNQDGLLSSEEFSVLTSEPEMSEETMSTETMSKETMSKETTTEGEALSFSMLDADADASISFDEATLDSNLIVAFASLDADNNQELSEEEYHHFMAK